MCAPVFKISPCNQEPGGVIECGVNFTTMISKSDLKQTREGKEQRKWNRIGPEEFLGPINLQLASGYYRAMFWSKPLNNSGDHSSCASETPFFGAELYGFLTHR